MKVKLLHHSPLWLVSNAIRMSRDNFDKSDTQNGILGQKDKELIERVGNKLKHKSVLEQAVLWFEIDGISRVCLHELARHRTARLTVKSTRYTLKELKDEKPFKTDREGLERAKKYIVLHPAIARGQVEALETLRRYVKHNTSNDIAKYALPETYKTKLQWQIDLRNFQNFLELRTSKDALWEIRKLAFELFDVLPDDYKDLCKEYLK